MASKFRHILVVPAGSSVVPPELVREAADAGIELTGSGWPVLDPTEYLVPRAPSFSAAELAAAESALAEDGVFPDAAWREQYLGLSCPEDLTRCAVKFGWALAYAAELAHAQPQDCVFAFARGLPATSALEHVFLASELQARGVRFAALELAWPEAWETANDYTGDTAEFAQALERHAAIAKARGHGLSFAHGEEKFSLLPQLGRCESDWQIRLEGLQERATLRALARHEPAAFRALLERAQEVFVFARTDAPLSTTEDDVRFLPEVPDAELEKTFLDDFRGRQLLTVSAPQLLAEPSIAGLVQGHAALSSELLAADVRRHLRALTSGETAT